MKDHVMNPRLMIYTRAFGEFLREAGREGEFMQDGDTKGTQIIKISTAVALTSSTSAHCRSQLHVSKPGLHFDMLPGNLSDCPSMTEIMGLCVNVAGARLRSDSVWHITLFIDIVA